MKKSYESGFGLTGLLVALVTVAVVGLVAYRYLSVVDNTEVATTSTPTTKVQPKIATVADIDSAQNQLDDADLDATFESDLDAELNF